MWNRFQLFPKRTTLLKTFLCLIFLDVLPSGLTFYRMRKVFQETASNSFLLWVKFTLERVAKLLKKSSKIGISRVNLSGCSYAKIDRNLNKGRKKDMLEEIKLFSWPKMYIQFHNKILVPVLILNTFIIRILNFTFEFLLTTELLMAGPKSCIRRKFHLKTTCWIRVLKLSRD